MKIKVPSYFARFSCSASACADSCCEGWDIAVDDKTYDKYSSLPGEFLEDILSKIADVGEERYILCESGRCPFLTECGLCRVISELGEEYLPDICDRHPRYFTISEDVAEGGIGLCCIEGAKLILSTPVKEAAELITAELPRLDGEELKIPLLPEYAARGALRVREELFSIIPTLTPAQIVEGISRLAEEIICGSDMGEDREEFWQNVAFSPRESVSLPEDKLCAALHSDLLTLCELECMSEEWRLSVASAEKNISKHPAEFVKFLNTDFASYLSRLVFYFIHRYMYEGVFLAEVGARVRFSLACAMSISALCYASETEDYASVAKDFSKNVEYSEQNLVNLISGNENSDLLFGEGLSELFAE